MFEGVGIFWTTREIAMTRHDYNLWMGIVPSLAMVAFTAVAAIGHFNGGSWTPFGAWDVFGKNTGKVLVAIWVLFPPVFLWGDWLLYWPTLDKDAQDAAKHLHDLSRNIWLGLVAVLVATYGLKITGG
jgi:hypothetical protein